MIKIQNIYYMLAYAFQTLNQDSYSKVSSEEFEHVADLFAVILGKGIAKQIKKGLGKEYICQSEALSLPCGKIDISASIKSQTHLKRKLICDFDDYSENNYLNQILKTTVQLLIRSNDVKKRYKKNLDQIKIHFEAVDLIDPYSIQWTSIRFHRNNATYQMLVNICFLVINGLLMTNQSGTKKLSTYLDDQRMHSLYEKFILEYYRKHYPEFAASPSHIGWDIDDGIIDFLPTMKSDITLLFQNKVLIIDAKYYSHTMQKNQYSDKKTIHSNNLYQIFTYVKNKDVDKSGQVSGLLLYAKTDEEISPNNSYVMGGNKISVKTLDLNTDFTWITKQLDLIANDLIKSI